MHRQHLTVLALLLMAGRARQVDANTPLNDTSLPIGQLYLNNTIPQWYVFIGHGHRLLFFPSALIKQADSANRVPFWPQLPHHRPECRYVQGKCGQGYNTSSFLYLVCLCIPLHPQLTLFHFNNFGFGFD
jgi:hypothetical protein